MTKLVVDASVALSWCFPDEANPYAQAVLRMLREADGLVPAIWPLEVANALVVAERRNRLRPAEASRFLALLRGLAFTVDPETSSQAFGETLSLARRHTLSVYDASYLELAVREDLPIATLDEDLKRAARALRVKLVAA